MFNRLRLTRLVAHPVTWFFVALLAYLLAAGRMYDQQSLAPHYIRLADSFLHGQISLRDPVGLYDLIITPDGNAYVAGSPLPAILLMPIVWLTNVEFSDVLFSIVIGALTVAAVQHAFRLPWLTLLFAFGTPQLQFAAIGSVWFQAHQVALLFGVLALAAGWRRQQWGWAGLWLALAALARPTLLFGSIGFAALMLRVWWDAGQPADGVRRPLWPLVAAGARFALPIVACIGAHGAYNAARFGDPTDFGYSYVVGSPAITAAYSTYGGFNTRFLACNLYVSLLNPPLIGGSASPVLYDVCDHLLSPGQPLASGDDVLQPNPLGMSVLLVTPAFLLLFGVPLRTRDALPAWIGLLAIMLPLWLYHNTGSTQFGYRYWMDAAPFWLLLLALGDQTAGATQRRLRIVLVALSIVINLWGGLWLYQLFVGRSWMDVWRLGRP